MIEFDNPDPKCDMHAGSVRKTHPDNPDIFGIRTWRAFSSKTLEFEGCDSFWWIDRATNMTYLIMICKRARFAVDDESPWHTYGLDEFNRHDARALLPEDHIREARWFAKTELGIEGNYRRLKLREKYGLVPPMPSR